MTLEKRERKRERDQRERAAGPTLVSRDQICTLRRGVWLRMQAPLSSGLDAADEEALVAPTKLQQPPAENAAGAEPFVGNVSKCCPLPPEHTGPPKKGMLEFDACFEGGQYSMCAHIKVWLLLATRNK